MCRSCKRLYLYVKETDVFLFFFLCSSVAVVSDLNVHYDCDILQFITIVKFLKIRTPK